MDEARHERDPRRALQAKWHAMQTPLFADHLLSLEEKGVSLVVLLGHILLWVKDFADPCNCIKDSDDSQLIKKTQIDSMLSANLNSLCVLECVDASKCK